MKLNTYEISNANYEILDMDSIVCPKCNLKKITKPEGHWVGKCPTCSNSYFLFWKPTPSQRALLDHERVRRTDTLWYYNIGSMNTGKTDIDMVSVVRHCLERPGAKVMILANDLNMIKNVVPISLNPFIHKDWLAKHDGKLKMSLINGYEFINGSVIKFFPSDDEQKYRSFNASKIVVIEGDKLKRAVVKQLVGRLRNDAGVDYARNEDGSFVIEDVMDAASQKVVKRKKITNSFFNITIEANPDASTYVYDEGVLEAGEIFHTPSVKGFNHYRKVKQIDNMAKVAFITATPDNPYTKPGYIEALISSWTPDELRRNLYAEFVANDRLVYPEFFSCVVEPREVDNDWPHWMAIDPGVGEDPTAITYKTFDPYDKVYYYYGEYLGYKKNLREIAAYINEVKRKKNLIDIIIDPSAGKSLQLDRITSTKKELEDLVGMSFVSAINSIDDGIRLVRSRMKDGIIKISNEMVELYKEASVYSYPEQGDERKLAANKSKPIGGNDHLLDTMRYLEQSTRSVATFSEAEQYYNAQRVLPERTIKKLPHAIQSVTMVADFENDEWNEQWGSDDYTDVEFGDY